MLLRRVTRPDRRVHFRRFGRRQAVTASATKQMRSVL
jgi:hypothetical protein